MTRLLLLACLILSACFTAGRRGGDSGPAVYDLGPPAVRPAAGGAPSLAVEVRAPHWLDSLGIQYRLAYAEPARLREYARARWAAPPSSLVQQRLVHHLGWSPAGQGSAGCLLRVELDEFSQIFPNPQESRGVLQARLAVFDGRRHRVAEQALIIEEPAPSPDSRGGLAALAAAVDHLGDDIGRWRDDLSGAGRLGGCGK